MESNRQPGIGWRSRDGEGKRRECQWRALVLQDLLPVPDGMTVVDLSDGRRVFAPEGTDPTAVRVHVAERETKR